MADFSIKKVLALPVQFEPNTLYIVASAEQTDEADLFISSMDGSSVRGLPKGVKASDILSMTETAPDPATAKEPFWFDPVKGTLFVRYQANDVYSWVEANPSAVIPEFGESGGLFGESEKMARLDHAHDSLVVAADW